LFSCLFADLFNIQIIKTMASENETINLPYSDLLIIKFTNGEKMFTEKIIL